MHLHVHLPVRAYLLPCVHSKMHVHMHPTLEGGVTVRDAIHNGMSAALLTEAAWRKSKLSRATGNCVEVAQLDGGHVAVRNSRFPDGPALVLTQAEVAAFLAGAKEGEFDDLVA